MQNENPGADERVEDMDVFIGERFAEFLLQNVLDRFDHEIDNRLRRIDDAVRIGDIDRKPLEKTLVNVVKERLFFGKAVDGRRRLLDGPVEMVKAFQKFFAAERLRCEGKDNCLDLLGNGVSSCEF